MSTHTPGPWFYRRGDEWSHSVVTKHGLLPDGSDNCWSVADINKRREPEHEANAHLISAAPDLLAAVQDLLAGWKYIRGFHGDLYGVGWDRAQDKAEAAIAKAEGRA